MQIKKFEAYEVSRALRAIKEEMGPDAVILSTREVRKKGAVILNRPIIEVTAAVDRSTPSGTFEEKNAHKFEEHLEAAARSQESEDRPVYEELRAIKASIEEIRKEDRLKQENKSGHGEALRGIQASLEGIQTESRHQQENKSEKIHETWLEMKVMLKALTDLKRQEEASKAPSALDKIFNQLISNGVDTKVTEALFKMMREKLPGEDLWKEDHVRCYLRQIIEGTINVTGPIPPVGDVSKAVMLVGPTGVGKTETIAKLAAEQIRKKRKVTLITLDGDRVGGVEKLMSYAKKIGVPVMVVGSGDALGNVVSQRRKGELILVDTPGRSHRNLHQLSHLNALNSIGIPFETHLVLSSNTRGTDMSDMIDRFSVVPIDSLLFTKMDETRTYGPLFTVMGRKKKPASYFTMGQRVPEDIEVANPKRLAELVLN